MESNTYGFGLFRWWEKTKGDQQKGKPPQFTSGLKPASKWRTIFSFYIDLFNVFWSKVPLDWSCLLTAGKWLMWLILSHQKVKEKMFLERWLAHFWMSYSFGMSVKTSSSISDVSKSGFRLDGCSPQKCGLGTCYGHLSAAGPVWY